MASTSANAIERLVPAARRTSKGLEVASVADALAQAANGLRAKSGVAAIASPFMTVEEAKSFSALAKSLGAKAQFVSPASSGLKDSLLNTGDPCPNRRGLLELGFEAISAESARSRVAESGACVLAGERVIELCGRAELAAIEGAHIVTFDTHALEGGSVDVCVGTPEQVEKIGHWVNVDGHIGKLTIARAAPSGVEPLTRTLDTLCSLLATSGANAR